MDGVVAIGAVAVVMLAIPTAVLGVILWVW
jgi:hypothetical protein